MDQQQLRQNKFANMVQTIKLIAGMAIILGLIGYAVGGRWVALGAILVALITGGIGPSVSAQMVLRMFKARRLDPAQAHQLFELRDILCRRAELRSFPALYYIPSRVLNAFATGSQDHYAIAMTDGLLRALNHRELAGVLAHEISHIRHRDVRIMALDRFVFADYFDPVPVCLACHHCVLPVRAVYRRIWNDLASAGCVYRADPHNVLATCSFAIARIPC